MANPTEDVIREIFGGDVKAPAKDDPSYPYIYDLASAIVDVRANRSLTPYQRLHQLNSLWSGAYNAVAKGKYERTTPSSMRKFYPGGYSQDGFLGWGESLEAIIADDKATVRRQRVVPKETGREPHAVLGSRLKQVLDNPGDFPRIKLFTITYRGSQECPFDECHRAIYPHSNTDFVIVRGREGLIGPGLIWHLIEAHCFFEGAYTPYRVDPELLAAILFG